MTRISLVDAYDNRDVIVQIENLKKGKQDKLNAGTGVTIDGNTINVDTSNLATKTALTAETARLDQKIDDVDNKIPPLASKVELADEAARLDQKIDDVDNKIPPLASKKELADEGARLDAKIDNVDAKIPPLASKEELDQQAARLDARVDASNVKINMNGEAIHNIEDELGSDSHPGTIYYRITNVEGEVITLKPIVNESIKSVEVEGDASTVYHRATHNSGVVETDALPVASETKAGVMSAGIYVAINGSLQNLQARMSVLEGVGLTYQLTGLPDNPTDAQITEAFRAQYPNVPLSAGIRAADYDKAKIWQYSGTNWIQLTNINVAQASSTTLGVVKGVVSTETNQGRIYIETDGTMSVVGWDALKALASSAKQSVDNLEPRVNQQSTKIDELEGDVAANGTDITALKATTRDHTSRIESLETSSADLNTRMGTAETDIDNLQASDSQQTTKISALEADMNNVKPRVGQLESDVASVQTKTTQNTQAINGLREDLAGKQDNLTAGENITIAGNVISAEGGETYVAGEGIKIEGNVISATNTSVPIYSPLIVGSIKADTGGSVSDVECDIAAFGTGTKSNSSYSLPYSTTKQTLHGINDVPQLLASTLNTQLDFSSLNIPNKHISYSLILIDSTNNVIDRLNGQGVLNETSKISVTWNQVNWFKLGSSNRNLSIAAVNVIWS